METYLVPMWVVECGVQRDGCISMVAAADAQATVEALQRERDEWRSNAVAQEARANDLERDCKDLQSDIEDERAKVKGLHEITKVICTHCCEPMEIPSKAVLQTQLTQLQALVRAWGTAHESVDDWFRRAATDENTPTISEFEAVKKVLFDSERALKATLDATTPAPDTSIIEKCEPPSHWDSNAYVQGDIS